ncbi:MAG: biphenyl 2,3-dioxygenase, partial [Halioglobus sp.]|nr:biphenyl 2,3-dioxygenase [Halioglobus sp.]
MTTARTIDTTPVPPAKLAHYVLRCRHFSATVGWYKKVLLAEAAFANDFVAFLSYDDEHHRIALVNLGPDAPAPAPGAGLDHVGFTVSGLPALMNHYHRLKADDILPAWCVHHGGTLSMYYDDPEGVRCEFQVELFDDPAVF